MSYIYLASPYTHPDEDVVQHRYEMAEAHTAYMLQMKLHVYSPIVHCHNLATRYNLPTNHKFWLDYNKQMLRAARELQILTLKGYEDSEGIAEETFVARLLNMPVNFVDYLGHLIQQREE